MTERKRIYLCLAHMSEDGMEQKYVKEAFDTNWVVPLGPNVNGFEKDLEEFVNLSPNPSPEGKGKAYPQPLPEGKGKAYPLPLPEGKGKAYPQPLPEGKGECQPLGGGLEGGRRVVALSSGTAAVHLGLLNCGVKAGDEVIVQSFTFCASSHPITYLGATPVFIDSERDTWNMDPDLLEEAIKDRIAKTGRKPKAIVPVALYGMPYRIDRIMEIADKYGIPVVEDAAEGFGSRYKGQMLGTFGKYGVLSFNGNKMITTSGGGALICNGCLSPNPSPKGKGSIHTADPMMYGLLKEYAEENRNKPTEAESALWEALKGKGIGEKFRRQHIISDFIVDFFCADNGLIIEIDGGYYHYPPQMRSDAERTIALSNLGYVEIRFTNEEVLGNIDGVLQTITNFCNALPRKSHPLGGDLEGADEQWREIMMYATQYRESYPYYQHEKIGYNYRMSNICAGIGRGQMTVANDHIAHHKHVQVLYEELLKDVKGVHVHVQPNPTPSPSPNGEGSNEPVFDSNYWLCTITIDPEVKVKGQEDAYKTIVTGAVGGAAGVIHAASSAVTDCQPNDNVEAMRVALDAAGIEARPVWKPMHCQPVYRRGKVHDERFLAKPSGKAERMVNGQEIVCQTSDTSVAYVNGVSEAIFKIGMCLPAGPYVSDEDVRYIVECIKEAIL